MAETDTAAGSGGALPAVIPQQVPSTANEESQTTGDAGNALVFQTVPPQPIKKLDLTFDRALGLATMPRGKWDEKTYAALGGFVAAIPGAIHSLHEGTKATPYSLQAFDIVEVFICGAFFIWWLASWSNLTSKKTAEEYLNELYQIPAPPKKKWGFQFWR